MFEFLFKYRYFLFERGSLAFRPLWPWPGAALAAAVLLVAAYFAYRRAIGAIEPRWRWVLTCLRAAAFLVCLLLSLQPVLVLRSVIPQRSFVAVVYDVSKSMSLRDGPGGQSRMEVARSLLVGSPSSLIPELSKKFRLRYFRFSGAAERTAGVEGVAKPGNRTDLQRSLEQVMTELSGIPVSGIVLITDGADNRSADLPSVEARLASRKIPVYAVGVGSSQIARDGEIVRVSVPSRVLKDSIVEADVAIRSTGYAGRKARLTVRDGNRTVQTSEVVLGSDSEVRTHKVLFSADQPGARVFSFRLEPFADESLSENNEESELVLTEDAQPSVLYVEGEPRWMYGFLRRAALEDKNLRLVTLLRQADGKFLRQGVESASTLERGFPASKAELFAYKALIVGSVEATFFTFDQLRMISDFVAARGGGFLMLGGRNSFEQGGYANTPLEDVLPLILREGQESREAGFEDVEFRTSLTAYGVEHPITRMAALQAESEKRWEQAPALVGLNTTGGPKPGATVLAKAKFANSRAAEAALLVFQRFGRGKSLALTTGSIWRWRMELDHRDNFHDQFWKQMLRWLVADVQDAVQVAAAKGSFAPDEGVSLRGDVSDPTFLRINDARVTARVKGPSGETTVVPLLWDIGKDGQYSGSFKPAETGIYEVTEEAVQGSRTLGSARTAFRVADSNEEFHNAELHADLLRRLASATGGRFYTPAGVRHLPEDIAYVDSGVAKIEEKELWDAPFFFLLLTALVCAEWILRKRKGLA